MKKNITCKTQTFYILVTFLSIAITLLIAVKHLLPLYGTKSKPFCLGSIN